MKNTEEDEDGREKIAKETRKTEKKECKKKEIAEVTIASNSMTLIVTTYAIVLVRSLLSASGTVVGAPSKVCGAPSKVYGFADDVLMGNWLRDLYFVTEVSN